MSEEVHYLRTTFCERFFRPVISHFIHKKLFFFLSTRYDEKVSTFWLRTHGRGLAKAGLR